MEEEETYVARPFNVYLFPYSENYIDINDEQRILQYTPSCLRFNMKNNFNFNKLFRMGINYRRMFTEAEPIRKLVEAKIDESIVNGRFGVLAANMRSKNCLCEEDQVKIRFMMECIKEFMESGSDEYKTELTSYIARKCLAT